MNGIRRGLVLLGPTVAIVIGASVPALATYSEAIAVTTTITTTAVAAPRRAAPTSVVGKLTCGYPSTMSATWATSTTARVSGYQLAVYFSDGFVQTDGRLPVLTAGS